MKSHSWDVSMSVNVYLTEVYLVKVPLTLQLVFFFGTF